MNFPKACLLLWFVITAFVNADGQSTVPLSNQEKIRASITKEIFGQIIDSSKVAPPYNLPAWEKGAEYFRDDLVMFEGEAYQSLIDRNVSSPENTQNWDRYLPAIRIDNVKGTYGFQGGIFLTISGKELLANYRGKRDSLGRIIIERPVIFTNCELNFWLELNGFNFLRGVVFENCILGRLNLWSVTARDVAINNCSSDFIGLRNSTITSVIIDRWSPVSTHEAIKPFLNVKNCTFGAFGVTSPPNDLVAEISKSKITGLRDKALYMGESSLVTSKGQYTLKLKNTLVGAGDDASNSSLQGNFIDILIDSCGFNSDINFYSSIITNKLYITNSGFTGLVAVNNASLSGDIKVRWTQLEGNKIAAFRKSDEFIFKYGFYTEDEKFTTVQGEGVSDLDAFEEIMKTYQLFYNSYRQSGDIESANGCYAEMKDVQTRRLAFLHSQQGTFKSFFRLKLSQLMKLYTEHGTDPAKAIVVSVWVVLCFAIFFFFFPSDWDVTSKAALIRNFNDFITKNEKGYIKPFFVLLAGFLISLINAFTLSLNAFTTLGFGNIPTHGVARYFCVLEGFIGWFLLSIFTVALINQALT